MVDKDGVGRAISEQRKIKGMTQKQLADILNVSYQAVSRWEQGVSLPSVDMIYDIAQILGTTVDFLLNGLREKRRIISFMDSGLDSKRLYMVKDRLNSLVSKDEMLLHVKTADPVIFKPDAFGREDKVCAFANLVPGSKERVAIEKGYDREICVDLVSNTANSLARFRIKPAVLQGNMVCGNNDSGQILMMGEAFKEACERSGIVFAGLEVAAQAVNYRPGEYKLGALAFGTADRKKLITGERVAEGDAVIGIYTEGISTISYPFIKVILERRPDIAYAKVDGQNMFMDELMKPNTSYADVLNELNEQELIHGLWSIDRSLFKPGCYRTMPEGLGACISVSSIQVPALFRYLYDLNMMDKESFLEDFSLGIGMVLAVKEEHCGKVTQMLEKSHKCCRLGRIEKDGAHPGAKVWAQEKNWQISLSNRS